MKKNERNYCIESILSIDDSLKRLDNNDDNDISMTSEEKRLIRKQFLMWSDFIKLMGENVYNNLMEKENFKEFHESFRQTDIEMDLFKAPLQEITLTSVSSDDESSFEERKTYRRQIETNESYRIRYLIYYFICISNIPKYIWETVKNVSDEK